MAFLLLLFAADPDALKKSDHVDAVREVIAGDRQIIHIRDWHFIRKETFAIDTGLAGRELDQAFDQHRKDVERIQQSIHGILKNEREVYVEGLTDKNYPIFCAEIRVLKRFQGELKELSPDDGPAAKELLDRHALTLLRIGAAGQLMLQGTLTVLPCEGVEYEVTPIKDGAVVLDEREIEAREDAIVRNLLKKEGTVVLVLGGAHDLSNNVRRLSTECGYTVVTPKHYPK